MSSVHSIGSMNQLADAFDAAGFSPEDVTKLRQADLAAILRVLRGTVKIVPVSSVLEFLGTVAIPARTERFFAKEKFVVNVKPTAPVKIDLIGDNFTQWFGGKIEDPMTQQALRYAKLRQSSVDGPIVAELGGEATAETTLAEIYALMEQQPNGEHGILLTNGYANIIYVRDINGVLRAVHVRWDDDGWLVSADSVDVPYEWSDGSRVFSRNS